MIFAGDGDETIEPSRTLSFSAGCPSTSLRTRSEQALPYFQALCKLPTWIHLPIKTNFFFYHVKLAENGKNKTSRSEQALPCIFQPCGNYLYLYLFKPDRLRIFLDLSNPCLFFNHVATTFEYACHYQFLYQQAENMVQNFNSRSEQSCLNLLKALWSTCPLDLKLTLDCWYYGRASTNTVLNQMYFTQQ